MIMQSKISIFFLILLGFGLILLVCFVETSADEKQITISHNPQPLHQPEPQYKNILHSPSQMEPKTIIFNKHNTADKVDYKIFDELFSVTLGDEIIVHMHYPQISGMTDINKQGKINGIIKNYLILILDKYESPFARELNTGNPLTKHDLRSESPYRKAYLRSDYEIIWHSNTLLSIRYLGDIYVERTAHPSTFIYTLNIDLTTGNLIELDDLINLNEIFIKNWRQHKITSGFMDFRGAIPLPKNITNTSVEKELDEYEKEGWLIEHFDARYGTVYPHTTVYFTKNSLGIVLLLSKLEFGGHVMFDINYKDIPDSCIKDISNPIWNDLLQ
jgi:hypothetical protein